MSVWIAISIVLLLPVVAARAQLLPDRNVVFAPLSGNAGAGTHLLAGADLYGEFCRTLRGDDDHRWSARVGGSANIVRIDSSFSLDMLGMTEIIIDPNNDIAFNPRAIFWEEGIVATLRATDRIDLQLGFSHRCKHDIDNLETELERTLIYSSVYGRVLTRRLPVAARVSLRGALRLDSYLYRLDSRSTSKAAGVPPDIEHLVGSGALTLRLDWQPWSTPLALALTATGGGSLFTVEQNGVALLSNTSALDLAIVSEQPGAGTAALFVRWEYRRDNGIQPLPTPAALAWIGVRIGATDRMW